MFLKSGTDSAFIGSVVGSFGSGVLARIVAVGAAAVAG